MTNEDVQKRTGIRNLGSAEGLQIFCGRYIVGTLTNKATFAFSITQSLIAFPLTPKHVTLNNLEWSFCVKFCFALVRLQL